MLARHSSMAEEAGAGVCLGKSVLKFQSQEHTPLSVLLIRVALVSLE